MSSAIDKLRYYYKLGGIKLIGLRAFDSLSGSDRSRSKQYIYECSEKADPKDYAELIKLRFKALKDLDLDLDNPKTFNDKIQWMKIHDKSPIKSVLTDKYAVREWIEEKIGAQYLIPLLGVWDSFDEIDFSKLPDKFVLKANHGSTWNIIVKNKNELDIDDAKEKFDSWMKTNYAFVSCFEMQYTSIKPKIIAEAFVETPNDDLYDYKFHCFNGEPKIIEVIGERVQRTHTGKETIMTPEWTRHPGKSLITMPEFEELPAKPENYDKMLEIVKTLSEEFSYVRVDLYNVNGKIYFGEMTFTPNSGADPTDEYFTYADLIKLPVDAD